MFSEAGSGADSLGAATSIGADAARFSNDWKKVLGNPDCFYLHRCTEKTVDLIPNLTKITA